MQRNQDQSNGGEEDMKKCIWVLTVLCLLTAAVFTVSAFAEADNAAPADPAAEEAAQREAAERGLAAIQETRFPEYLVLPKEESYLKEWKTGYARKAFKAPCLRVERISQLHTGRDVMPYIYEGTEATVLAEENKMSLIIYRGSDDRFYAGWIQSIRILDDFPGDLYTIGKEPSGDLSFRDDIALDWSRCSWLNTQQNYTVLSEEVKDCIGFTLDYQIIAENTDVWQNILGPRKVYVKTGGEWVEVGEFPYPDFGAVKVQVWLDHPMDIDAVGTIEFENRTRHRKHLPGAFFKRSVFALWNR